MTVSEVSKALMSPVATYREARLEGRRTFALLADRVVISGKSIAGEIELSVPLATLSPVVSRLRLRSRFFLHGFALLILPWVVSGLFAISSSSLKISQSVVPAVSFSFIGLIVALVSGRKVEYARFTTDAGIAALDIARAGRETDKFDSFVEVLTKQIGIAKSASKHP